MEPNLNYWSHCELLTTDVDRLTHSVQEPLVVFSQRLRSPPRACTTGNFQVLFVWETAEFPTRRRFDPNTNKIVNFFYKFHLEAYSLVAMLRLHVNEEEWYLSRPSARSSASKWVSGPFFSGERYTIQHVSNFFENSCSVSLRLSAIRTLLICCCWWVL